jgi:hypothetical protein
MHDVLALQQECKQTFYDRRANIESSDAQSNAHLIMQRESRVPISEIFAVVVKFRALFANTSSPKAASDAGYAFN